LDKWIKRPDLSSGGNVITAQDSEPVDTSLKKNDEFLHFFYIEALTPGVEAD
jgi:hypothetical protein